MNKQLFPVAAVAVLGMTGTVSADEVGRYYAKVDVGHTTSPNQEVEGAGDLLKGYRGFTGGLGLGYNISDTIRADITVQYSKLMNKRSKILGSNIYGPSMGATSLKSMVNVYYNFILGDSKFTPFITVGAGVNTSLYQLEYAGNRALLVRGAESLDAGDHGVRGDSFMDGEDGEEEGEEGKEKSKEKSKGKSEEEEGEEGEQGFETDGENEAPNTVKSGNKDKTGNKNSTNKKVVDGEDSKDEILSNTSKVEDSTGFTPKDSAGYKGKTNNKPYGGKKTPDITSSKDEYVSPEGVSPVDGETKATNTTIPTNSTDFAAGEAKATNTTIPTNSTDTTVGEAKATNTTIPTNSTDTTVGEAKATNTTIPTNSTDTTGNKSESASQESVGSAGSEDKASGATSSANGTDTAGSKSESASQESASFIDGGDPKVASESRSEMVAPKMLGASSTFETKRKTSFAYQGGAGVSYKVNDRMALDLSYNISSMDDGIFKSALHHTVIAGIRISF